MAEVVLPPPAIPLHMHTCPPCRWPRWYRPYLLFPTCTSSLSRRPLLLEPLDTALEVPLLLPLLLMVLLLMLMPVGEDDVIRTLPIVT